MPQSTFDEIIENYVEMNVAHLLREGKGKPMSKSYISRAMRECIEEACGRVGEAIFTCVWACDIMVSINKNLREEFYELSNYSFD